MKYRLGNQPEEYELKEDFLGFLPENVEWEDLFLFGRSFREKEITIIHPESGERKTLFFHHFLLRDAFPMEFFREARSRNWSTFAKVSDSAESEQFIIPLF